MADTEYFVPFYKICVKCYHDSDLNADCTECKGTGMVKVFIELEEYADLTGMSEEALHNLKCGLKEA